jgi:hypothetical protein
MQLYQQQSANIIIKVKKLKSCNRCIVSIASLKLLQMTIGKKRTSQNEDSFVILIISFVAFECACLDPPNFRRPTPNLLRTSLGVFFLAEVCEADPRV